RRRAPSSPAAAGTRLLWKAPRTHRTGAAAVHAPQPGTAPPRASAPVLQFFCDQVLHRGVVERQLRVHPLELGVLGLELPNPLEVGRLHAAVLRLPLVVRGDADAGLPAQILDRDAGVSLLEDRDDLGLGESGLLHGTSWLGETCQKVLLAGCLRGGEAYATTSRWLASALVSRRSTCSRR